MKNSKGGSMMYRLVKTMIIVLSISCLTSAQISNSTISDKVKDYLRLNMSNSVGEVLQLYDDNVDFYKKGIVNKSFILNDKTSYFNKWPQRFYNLSSDIKIYKVNNYGKWKAKFNYTYSVSNSKRTLKGEAWCELVFQNKNGSLKIISEKGGIIKKGNRKNVSKYPSSAIVDGVKLAFLKLEDPTLSSVFYKSIEGKRLIGVIVKIQNGSTVPVDIKVSNFNIVDNYGATYSPSLGMAKTQMKDVVLSKGKSNDGLIPFVMPYNRSPKYIIFKFGAAMKSIKIGIK